MRERMWECSVHLPTASHHYYSGHRDKKLQQFSFVKALTEISKAPGTLESYELALFIELIAYE